jgi:hypothetical protein
MLIVNAAKQKILAAGVGFVAEPVSFFLAASCDHVCVCRVPFFAFLKIH